MVDPYLPGVNDSAGGLIMTSTVRATEVDKSSQISNFINNIVSTWNQEIGWIQKFGG